MGCHLLRDFFRTKREVLKLSRKITLLTYVQTSASYYYTNPAKAISKPKK
jgi:hypothetical protein